MAEKKINPILKLVLEIGPIAAFFIAYRYAGGEGAEAQLSGMLTATAVFVPLQLAAIGLSWFLTGHLPRMALITAAVVVVFGGLTLALRDDTFIKMKPTVIYLCFAGVLGFGLMRGQSYLEYLMGETMPLAREGWMIFTRRFALLFLALAVANEIVWRVMGTDAWVKFKTFVIVPVIFLFILSQGRLFRRYGIEQPE
ncbi:MAG: septation protein A [Alphaproteobacteria bacterium]|nr:MAG: septation protein A [Alphaproteobacteria bacterium]